MKNDLIELGISEDRIKLLPNGVDTTLFSPSEKKEDNLLLFVGRITFIKGLHVLIESLNYIETPVRLVIFGPIDKYSKYSEDILSAIERTNKIGKHKLYYMGKADQKDLTKWYPRASIFVSPSIRDAFPMVNVEALSCGTPVVSTNVGGIPEVICDGINGILVPPYDAKKLANAIEYLLCNENVRNRYGKEGRKWVEENLSIKALARRLIKIYEESI
jgi:glycosyltransferase involved in cell wall biosynthesis